jgi:type I restriction enzyme M protein
MLHDRMRELFDKAAKNLGVVQPALPFRSVPATALESCIFVLQSISLTRSARSCQQTSDVLGDFFEKTLSTTFKQSKGQFFTHKNVADFSVRLAGVAELVTVKRVPSLPTVIDPSAGSGTFLIEALRQMEGAINTIKADHENGKASLTNAQISQLDHWSTTTQIGREPSRAWAAGRFYGIESNSDLSLVCKLNMLMHCADAGHISNGDALMPVDGVGDAKFDFVLSNPPFSVTLSEGEVSALEARDFSLAKNASTKRSEHLFLELWHRLLCAGGCFSVVVPEAMVDVPKYRSARMYLITHFWVDAVISLPKSAFEPFTGTKTVVLRATKKSDAERFEWDEAMLAANALFKTEAERVKYAFENVSSARDRYVFLAEPEQLGYARRGGKKADIVTPNDLLPEGPMGKSVLCRWQERAYDQRDRRFGFWIKLSDITVRPSLRLDPKHHWLWTVNGGCIDPRRGETQPLRSLLTLQRARTITKGPLGSSSGKDLTTPPGELIDELDGEEGEGRWLVDVTTGNGFPTVTEELSLEATGPRIEFGNCDIALFSLPPFKVLRNKADRHWIGRYIAFTPHPPRSYTTFCDPC